MKKQWLGWLGGLGLVIVPVVSPPAWGAERIYISYAAFERSIPIEALEIYAKEGRITKELAGYARYLNPQQRTRLRAGLRARVNQDNITISQFLYSPSGEQLLRRLGKVIQTESRQSGFYAIRAALIQAAAEPEGITALNVLRQFPTDGIRVNLAVATDTLRQVEQLVDQTAMAVTAVRNQSQAQASGTNTNASQLHGLQDRGPFSWQKETLKLEDASRARLGLGDGGRTFLADVYLPKEPGQGLMPVIVFSHGLGSDRQTYAYLAEHLASYGFAVAVPEHPGSGAQQVTALLNGQASEVAEPSEFVERPLDVTFLLDELGRRGATPRTSSSQIDSTYYRRLNLQQVGVIGHSFGGYTALALAGARLNFEQLEESCGTNLDRTLNVSLLLQCRALTLPKRKYNLSDSRVKAVVAIDPLTSSVFGQPGLSLVKVPAMLVAGSADTVTPALLEQIQPFTWLSSSQKYLTLIEGATHFSTTGESAVKTGALPVPPEVIGPSPSLARRYLNALSAAFFQTYINKQPGYACYLTPAYATAISQAPLRLSITQMLDPAVLEKLLSSSLPKVTVTTSARRPPIRGEPR